MFSPGGGNLFHRYQTFEFLFYFSLAANVEYALRCAQ